MASSSMYEVAMLGLALPSVPMSEVVSSYSYDLLADGRWVNRHASAVGRIQVDADGVSFVPLQPGIVVSGRRGDDGSTVIAVTASTLAPHVFRYPGVPDAAQLRADVTSPTDFFTDALGEADWRRAVTAVLAERVVADLMTEDVA